MEQKGEVGTVTAGRFNGCISEAGMKLAAIVPIGSLAEKGYQHVFEPCIRSIAEFADAVYLVQSINDNRNLWQLEGLYNVNVISNPSTWFDGDYDGKQINRNLDLGCQAAKNNGADIAILMTSNCYIPVDSAYLLRWAINHIRSPFNFYYRGNFVAGKLFKPSKRLPYILNLSYFPETRFSFDPDGLFCDGEFISPSYGDFSQMEFETVIDVPLEMTLDELTDKLNFVRCYSDALPKRNAVFDWNYWKPYMIGKIAACTPSDKPLDKYGLEIARIIRDDFISHEILRELDYAPA